MVFLCSYGATVSVWYEMYDAAIAINSGIFKMTEYDAVVSLALY